MSGVAGVYSIICRLTVTQCTCRGESGAGSVRWRWGWWMRWRGLSRAVAIAKQQLKIPDSENVALVELSREQMSPL